MSRTESNGRISPGECAEGEVQVWHYILDVNAEKEETLIRVLSDEEIERVNRYRFDKHRRRFIAGRGILRAILAHYLGCEPQALGFGHGEHGKPYIAWPQSAHDIRFSASDSHGLGAVAVTQGNELGLDIEKVRHNSDQEQIVAREFAAEERDWFCGLPEDERARAFHELWTCKEAYLKAKGVGLAAPLNSFAISMSRGAQPRLSWSAIDNADPQRWLLHRLAIDSGFATCLAVEGSDRPVRVGRWLW